MKAEAVAVEAAGQRYSQVDTFVYLGSTISSVGDVGPEIKRRTGYAWNCFLKYSRAVYDNLYIAVADKVRFLKVEVLEVMFYGCATWTLSPGDFDKLRAAHHGMLLRCLNGYTSTRAAPDYHMLSYLEVPAASRACTTIASPTSSCEAKWSGGRENGASLRNASNTVSRNTALPSESTPNAG